MKDLGVREAMRVTVPLEVKSQVLGKLQMCKYFSNACSSTCETMTAFD